MDCEWRAATLPAPVSYEGVAKFAMTLQYAGAQIRCYPLPSGAVLMVSWKRPNAQIS